MIRRAFPAIVPVLMVLSAVVYAAQQTSSSAVLVRGDSGLVLAAVVAGPGDRVQISDGQLIVNGQRTDARISEAGNWGPRIVAPRTYFIAGDPAGLGNDAREWGLVGADRIVGTVHIGMLPMR